MRGSQIFFVKRIFFLASRPSLVSLLRRKLSSFIFKNQDWEKGQKTVVVWWLKKRIPNVIKHWEWKKTNAIVSDSFFSVSRAYVRPALSFSCSFRYCWSHWAMPQRWYLQHQFFAWFCQQYFWKIVLDCSRSLPACCFWLELSSLWGLHSSFQIIRQWCQLTIHLSRFMPLWWQNWLELFPMVPLMTSYHRLLWFQTQVWLRTISRIFWSSFTTCLWLPYKLNFEFRLRWKGTLLHYIIFLSLL